MVAAYNLSLFQQYPDASSRFRIPRGFVNYNKGNTSIETIEAFNFSLYLCASINIEPSSN